MVEVSPIAAMSDGATHSSVVEVSSSSGDVAPSPGQLDSSGPLSDPSMDCFVGSSSNDHGPVMLEGGPSPTVASLKKQLLKLQFELHASKCRQIKAEERATYYWDHFLEVEAKHDGLHERVARLERLFSLDV